MHGTYDIVLHGDPAPTEKGTYVALLGGIKSENLLIIKCIDSTIHRLILYFKRNAGFYQ